MKIIFSQQSLKTLEEIYEYIAIINHNKESADILIDSIHTKVQILANIPKIGRVFRGENIRFVIVKKYIIVYKIYKKYILITRIYRFGQDWQ